VRECEVTDGRHKNRHLYARQPTSQSRNVAGGGRLTAENHHADGEDLLVLGEGGHVTEADTRHAGQSEVKSCSVSHTC